MMIQKQKKIDTKSHVLISDRQAVFPFSGQIQAYFSFQILVFSCDLSELLSVRKLHFCTKDAYAWKPVYMHRNQCTCI